MSVLDFPHGPTASADDYPTVGLPFIIRELGQRRYGLQRQIAYVTRLIAECGFPPPYPALVGKKGQEALTNDVVKSSSWHRAAVETWLEDFLPPANAAALDARAAQAAADDMDAAAAGLKLVGGREQ